MSAGESKIRIGKTSDALRRIKLGSSDLEVTEVCGGTMTWGSFNDEESEAFEQLDALWRLGVNFYDTAEMYPVAFNYGRTTEEWLGRWMAARTISRDRIVIATKVNCMGIGSSEPPVKHAFELERVEDACRGSLARLKTNYIDLYQLHFPTRYGPGIFGWGSYVSPERFEETRTSGGEIEVFEKQVLAIKNLLDLGLIKHWGLSNENAYGVSMFCLTADKLGVPRPVSIQNDFSLNNRVFEGDVAEACHEFGVVGLHYGALAGGVLTGKYIDQKYQGDRQRNLTRHILKPDFQPRYNNPLAHLAAREYVRLAEDYGLKPLELALAWARDRSYNAAIIIGTTTVQQVIECVEAFKLDPLPQELNRAVDSIHERFRNPQAAYADKEGLMDRVFWEEHFDKWQESTCNNATDS